MASKNKGRKNLIKQSRHNPKRWYLNGNEMKMHKHLVKTGKIVESKKLKKLRKEAT